MEIFRWTLLGPKARKVLLVKEEEEWLGPEQISSRGWCACRPAGRRVAAVAGRPAVSCARATWTLAFRKDAVGMLSVADVLRNLLNFLRNLPNRGVREAVAKLFAEVHSYPACIIT